MIRLAVALIICFACVVACAGDAKAQRVDWMTDNGDAQRSAWIRSDAKINKDSMSKPDFQFLWKMKLKNPPRQLNNLTPPATLDRLIGYRGFRMLGFVAGSSDNLFAIDTDLGRMEWDKHLNSTAPAGPGTLTCPGGITTGMARPALTSIPALPGAGGRGRSNPAKSAVGEPGQGAVTLANVRPNPPAPAAAAAPAAASNPMLVQPTRVNPANPPGGQLGAGPFLVFALAGDGKLHSLHMSNGADYEPPMKFLPPNANASGLIVTDQYAYAATEGGCGGAPNGVWAIDLVSKEVKTWKGNVVGSAGMAFGGAGAIYVVTGAGGDNPNSLVALDPKTLALKASYSAGAQEFSSSPVIFDYKGKTLIAAATKNGSLHLFDAANLSAPLSSSPASSKNADFAPESLSSWQDRDGSRWILVPTVGTQAADAGFKADNGAIKNGAVVAWKVVDQNGAPSLQPGWASRDLVSPLTPTIINGVVFVTSGGEFRTSDSKVNAAQRASRSSRAVIYALDGATGKELWNSGSTITSFARGAALAGGMSQIYLTTYDGVIYAFGFPMEH